MHLIHQVTTLSSILIYGAGACVPLVGRAARDIRRLSMPGTRLVQVDHATRNFRALMCMYSFDYAGIGHLLLRHCLSEAQQKSASLEVVRAVLSSGSSLAFVLSSGLQRSWVPARYISRSQNLLASAFFA
jgi:hypothetical protein